MTKNVCRKCHRNKKRSVLARHQKNCIPSETDIIAYRINKGSSMSKKDKQEQKAKKP